MFQHSERFFELELLSLHKVKHGYDFETLVEDIRSMEMLVRTERDVVRLEILIEQASDAFGVCMEDYLHE